MEEERKKEKIPRNIMQTLFVSVIKFNDAPLKEEMTRKLSIWCVRNFNLNSSVKILCKFKEKITVELERKNSKISNTNVENAARCKAVIIFHTLETRNKIQLNEQWILA